MEDAYIHIRSETRPQMNMGGVTRLQTHPQTKHGRGHTPTDTPTNTPTIIIDDSAIICVGGACLHIPYML